MRRFSRRLSRRRHRVHAKDDKVKMDLEGLGYQKRSDLLYTEEGWDPEGISGEVLPVFEAFVQDGGDSLEEFMGRYGKKALKDLYKEAVLEALTETSADVKEIHKRMITFVTDVSYYASEGVKDELDGDNIFRVLAAMVVYSGFVYGVDDIKYKTTTKDATPVVKIDFNLRAVADNLAAAYDQFVTPYEEKLFGDSRGKSIIVKYKGKSQGDYTLKTFRETLFKEIEKVLNKEIDIRSVLSKKIRQVPNPDRIRSIMEKMALLSPKRPKVSDASVTSYLAASSMDYVVEELNRIFQGIATFEVNPGVASKVSYKKSALKPLHFGYTPKNPGAKAFLKEFKRQKAKYVGAHVSMSLVVYSPTFNYLIES